MRNEPGGSESLRRLATAHRVAVSYRNAFGQDHQVGEKTLLAVLQAMGVAVETPEQAAALLEAETGSQASKEAALPAVLVAWEGELAPLVLGPPELGSALQLGLALEDGSSGDELLSLGFEPGGVVLRLNGVLPYGVHQLVADRPAQAHGAPAGQPSRLQPEPDEITIISAPRRASLPPERAMGLFAPAYGLWSEKDESASLAQLGRLGRFFGRRGVSYLATLPVLADDPGLPPSPYSPLSRLFWHEGYLDPAGLPELSYVLNGASVPPLPGQRAEFLLPHLAAAEERLLALGGGDKAAYEAYLARRPDVLSYARYRAARHEKGGEIGRWPERWRKGLLEDQELDSLVLAAHRYGQFAFDRQLGELKRGLADSSCQLMLDLPIGCRGDGYDPWAYASAFASGVRIGAPPDRFFTGGQDWGFPPLIPEVERAGGHAVTRACLTNLLAHAGALRIDHALGLSRLWWIPEGFAPTEGTYVSYPTDELLALFCLEAWRHDAYLVGEDLGTVQPELVSSLRSHGIAGMSVAVFELESERAHPMEPLDPPAGTVAMVDTHDTATLAGWLSGEDICARLELGLLSREEAAGERSAREKQKRILFDRLLASGLLRKDAIDDPVEVHAGLLEELGSSEADLVMVNLEDCWGETDPQNVPGTSLEHANFQRRLARSMDEIESDEAVARAFSRLRAARRARAAIPSGDVGY